MMRFSAYREGEIEAESSFIAKNYDGYRMMWENGRGFSMVEHESEDGPTRRAEPGPERINAFREDAKRAAQTDPVVQRFLKANRSFLMDSRTIQSVRPPQAWSEELPRKMRRKPPERDSQERWIAEGRKARAFLKKA